VKRLRIALGIMLVAVAVNAHAATYYVDQTAGSDGNTGTSPTSAWKNAPGMAAYSWSGSLRPGDTVYFDRADTWVVTGNETNHFNTGPTNVHIRHNVPAAGGWDIGAYVAGGSLTAPRPPTSVRIVP
jgi:hypothetical protein